jgi:hypothetical protein
MASTFVIAGQQREARLRSRLTRQSVGCELFRKMDARVKPAHDG